MEESIVERVLVLIKDYGLTASEFADKIDVQRSSMSHLVSGRNKPSLDFIQKILNNFSDINPTWLIMGSGPMKQLDLFDIKGDVAPLEPIPAEKFSTDPLKASAVVEQTSIKQSFQEIAAPQQAPAAVYAQSVPVAIAVVEPVSIAPQSIQREEPVFMPTPALTATVIQPPVEPIVAVIPPQVNPAQVITAPPEPVAAPIAAVIPPAPVQPPVAAPIAEIPTPQVAQSAQTTEKSVQNDKKVTKIVFFYSDNSFESFNPQ